MAAIYPIFFSDGESAIRLASPKDFKPTETFSQKAMKGSAVSASDAEDAVYNSAKAFYTRQFIQGKQNKCGWSNQTVGNALDQRRIARGTVGEEELSGEKILSRYYDRCDITEDDFSDLLAVLDLTPETVWKYVSSCLERDRLMNNQLPVLLENIELLLAHANEIISTPEWANIRFNEMCFSIAYTSRKRPITLGELLTHWNDGYWKATCPKCNAKGYVYSLAGSPLSGTNYYSMVCPQCHKKYRSSYIRTNNSSPFANNWQRAMSYKSEIEYQSTQLSLSDLVAILRGDSWSV